MGRKAGDDIILRTNVRSERERIAVRIFSCEHAKTTIESVMNWLRSEDESDVGWIGRTNAVEGCVWDLRGATPFHAYKAHKVETDPEILKLKTALSDIETMWRSMRQRDRHAALDAGASALERLAPGTSE